MGMEWSPRITDIQETSHLPFSKPKKPEEMLKGGRLGQGKGGWEWDSPGKPRLVPNPWPRPAWPSRPAQICISLALIWADLLGRLLHNGGGELREITSPYTVFCFSQPLDTGQIQDTVPLYHRLGWGCSPLPYTSCHTFAKLRPRGEPQTRLWALLGWW